MNQSKEEQSNYEYMQEQEMKKLMKYKANQEKKRKQIHIDIDIHNGITYGIGLVENYEIDNKPISSYLKRKYNLK